MAGMGPAPKPREQQRRPGRNLADRAVSVLPAEGRKGKLPAWPLGRKPSTRQAVVWAKLWKTPQATMWEQLGWTDTVARYARLVVLTEDSKPNVGLLMETRQLEDRLGLTSMSMLRLKWAIEPTDSDEPPAGTLDIRARLKASD